MTPTAALSRLIEEATLLETAARRFASGLDNSPSYVLKISERTSMALKEAKSALGRGENNGK